MHRLIFVPLIFLGSLAAQETAPQPEFSFYDKLVEAAQFRSTQEVRYVADYVTLEYPGGDVPEKTGVCTDVVIRSYRARGLDLQVLVHEDMKTNFSKYPQNWDAPGTDRSIDHRRVPNLQRYFRRKGAELPITDEIEDYQPGDVVAWDLNGNGLTHIGIVVTAPKGGKAGAWIVHNIGSGPRLDRRLFEWEIIGHYRFGEGVDKNYSNN
ncbi:MAG: hypothetical protein ACI8UO_000587 [Verrucomicrobiales bacterium]|jgi:uncharacterized protein YijF (DUF1287 family)